MTISTRDQLVDSMGNNSSRIVVDKASLSNAAAGQFHSLWRATGQPGQGAIPTTAAVCTHELTGAMGFTQQTAPATSYLAIMEGTSSNSAMTHEIHDRLVHSGGLVGNVATAQTTNAFDLSTLLATSNLDARKGSADYSDVQWWLEWYTATGATVATVTVNVNYDDGSTGNLTGFSLAATRRASLMVPLNGLIPAAAPGRFIRGWNSVTLSVSTGTAGSFGMTATRYRAANFMPIANARFTSDWAQLGLPEVPNSACLMNILLCSTTTTGTLRATGKVIHG
jgi:hypothetical protein